MVSEPADAMAAPATSKKVKFKISINTPTAFKPELLAIVFVSKQYKLPVAVTVTAKNPKTCTTYIWCFSNCSVNSFRALLFALTLVNAIVGK